MGKIIGIALGKDSENLNHEEFISFFQKYVSKRAMSVKNLYEQAKTNEALTGIFSDMTVEQINEAMWYLQLFVPFIEDPTILENLSKLYK